MILKATEKIALTGVAGVIFGLGLKGLVEPKIANTNPWILTGVGLGLLLFVTGKLKMPKWR